MNVFESGNLACLLPSSFGAVLGRSETWKLLWSTWWFPQLLQLVVDALGDPNEETRTCRTPKYLESPETSQ